MKFHIDKTGESPLCRMCRVENETVSHIVSQCKMLAQKEYKKRHDNVGRYIHWKLCEKYGFQGAQSGTSMIQMELLRTKSTRFCGILQFSAIPRLKFDDQILFLLIKLKRKLRL